MQACVAVRGGEGGEAGKVCGAGVQIGGGCICVRGSQLMERVGGEPRSRGAKVMGVPTHTPLQEHTNSGNTKWWKPDPGAHGAHGAFQSTITLMVITKKRKTDQDYLSTIRGLPPGHGHLDTLH